MQSNQTSNDLLALFDNAPLNRRYWTIFILMSAVFVFDFFDFLVVGYLLAAVAREWHLTYGQSAVILYSGGVGAIVGAVVFGAFADAWGRKQQMVIGTFICAISSGLIAFIPEGSWLLFAVLRFFVGVGLTAAVTPSLTVVVELTPTRHRTIATSFYVVFASAGGDLRLAPGRPVGLRRSDHRRPRMAVHAGIGPPADRQGTVRRSPCRGGTAPRFAD
jgi:MFS transporter, putative metabolite:H+ symporter